MTLTKKEKAMLIILAVLVYIFVFVKFVLLSSMQKIKEAKNRIQTVQTQLDALERDYSNIETFKKQIKENEIIDERLGEYLMDNAGFADSVKFVENLALLIGTRLKGISLGSPIELTEENATYYAFPVSFKTILTEEGINELLKFVEGGSRKVSVNSLNITPAGDETASEFGLTSSNEQLFDVNVSIYFYSIDKDAADNLARFTRAAFERFIENNDLPVFIEDTDKVDIAFPSRNTQAFENTGIRNAGSSSEITLMNADFKIFHRGYLFAGYNFETYSQFNRSERIRYHVGVPVDVTLILGKSQYTIEYADANGYNEKLTGSLPENENRDYTFFIQSNIANDVKENENIWVNVYIRNDSGRNLIIKREQTGDRVRIMDRDGNIIERKSDKEKVYI
ncbi:hypothetical protein Cst_c12670 [Thermoclostridium stercorarium subsp. stercorarium DSM 8532]|jgi:Tfp pilus assembly protein PilO|uniref:Uncharacterized protein n=3 Tax=Thermoclostridium stercorarium TaxID=1510 RepID=L7VRR6_THES1|nr:hypothetical protein [Thermoclostridium stercorarium]AGC68258.1 hypothetical protein Cst_c12670 [Thermoclostridium stercorarium subsp. stercorarium DSM 8532]AGI39285.1 hypothetical protein Clst_1224 [Thermoclostridium stercorarium subsp. stercorarium DSM 8532]ANW98619.1 hypothetical protein CSTERTH_06010 [Thermoclostridium stercorarium subsp. thermolacticum DSM 2910]ANX01160.1 hypothetical protein CSTERLE_06020 [Thermoclostridium stercorarium subsp. leptospartum DSM 9219]UZQ86774.1 hypothet